MEISYSVCSGEMLRCAFVNIYPKTIRHFSTTSISMGFEEKYIQLNCNKNTYNINYVRSGHGQNAMILLPGALGSASSDFKPQIEQLPKLLPNHTIIAWDPPGYGKSVPPKRTFPLDFFERDASVANTLMQTLNFPKYSILGWSDGGIYYYKKNIWTEYEEKILVLLFMKV